MNNLGQTYKGSRSIVRLNFLLSIGFGILMGVVFPLFAQFFVDYKSDLLLVLFTLSCIVAGIGVGLIAFLITRVTLIRIVKLVAGELGEIAKGEGDLSRRIQIRSKDAIGNLVSFFNMFVDKLSEMISYIKQTASKSLNIQKDLVESSAQTVGTLSKVTAEVETIGQQVEGLKSCVENATAAVEQTIQTIGSLDQQIETQTATLSQSTAAVNEMIASLNSVTKISHARQSSTESLVQTSQAGGERLGHTNGIVHNIAADVDAMLEMIRMINDISTQTNLLAMNAAIQAAHAGEYGKGFGVIAEEIRKLSESTAEGAKNISQVLKNTVENIQAAAVASQETRESFEKIDQEVQSVAGGLKEISFSTDELAAGSKQVLQAMAALDNAQARIKDGSSQMRAGSGEIADSMQEAKRVSAETLEKIRAVDFGITDITAVIVKVSEASEGLKKTVGVLNTEVAKFKT